MPRGALFAAVLALGLAGRGYGPTSAQAEMPSGPPTRQITSENAEPRPAYELWLDQSPAQAGKLSPDSGTHRFAADEVVVLSAEPQPGYQFAYWLGDVADPKSQRTTVHVNSSKVIVAIFQPAEPQPGYQFAYWLGDVADPKSQRTTVHVNSSKVIVAIFQPADDDPSKEVLLEGGGGGGGGLFPTRIDLSMPGYSLAGGGKGQSKLVPVPVPIPEPATVLLLGLGALALRRRRG